MKNFYTTQLNRNLSLLFLSVFCLNCTAQENLSTTSSIIAPNDSRIQIEGSNYIKLENGELVVHRHSDAVYAGTTQSNLFNPEKARSSSGILIKFKSNSPTLKVKFRMINGGSSNPVFAVFQNNEFIENSSFKFEAGSKISLNLVSAHPGEEVTYKIALPLKRDIHFLGLEIENGFSIVSFPEEKKLVYVAYGDSITHGTGQASTPETYPYILAEKFGFELFNTAVGGAKTSQVMAEMIRDDFKKIDVMTVLIGFNDYNGQGIDTETYKKRYNNILTTIRTKHPNTKIFCITMTATKANNSKVTGIAADDFRTVVKNSVANKQASGDTNIFLIEGEKITTEANLRDTVHFSVEGAQNFSNELYLKMNAILNQ